MRQARFLPPRRRWLSRVMPLLGLVARRLGLPAAADYFYYGYGAPALRAGRAGSDRPRQRQARRTAHGGHRGRHDVRRTPGRTTTVVGSEAPPRVVVSEPDDRPRTTWRRNPDPDPDVATTSVEGGVT